MLKICGLAIFKPLAITFKQCVDAGVFPPEWKKGNIVPIHKKGDKQTLKNYCPVSLLPICGRILEQVMFNEIIKFFIENDLTLSNQSGFKPGDSCLNQLVSVKHDIYKSFDELHEIRVVGMFSLTSRKHLTKFGIILSMIFKLTQNGISGNLLKFLRNFLSERRQRLVLNGQVSLWINATAGVPQGSILCPLLLLIYISDLFSLKNFQPMLRRYIFIIHYS